MVPHAEELRSKDFIDLIIKEWGEIEYLPDSNLKHQPHCAFLSIYAGPCCSNYNIGNTFEHDQLKRFIKNILKKVLVESC